MAYTSLQNLLEEQHEVGNAVSEDRDTYSLFQGLDRSCSCLTEFTQRYTSKQMLHPRASYGVLAASALRSLPRYRGLNPIEKLVKFRLSNFFACLCLIIVSTGILLQHGPALYMSNCSQIEIVVHRFVGRCFDLPYSGCFG
jgi:hypothetical protein